jgi:hypothetical protein
MTELWALKDTNKKLTWTEEKPSNSSLSTDGRQADI